MKLFSLILLFVGFNASAGPEEHLAIQTCYTLQAADLIQATAHIPVEICLESLSVDESANSISAYSYFTPNLYKNLKLTYLVRKNEDFYDFKSSGLIFQSASEDCGEYEHVELLISGLTDFYGVANISQLNIAVRKDFKNDICHSPMQTKTLTYILE